MNNTKSILSLCTTGKISSICGQQGEYRVCRQWCNSNIEGSCRSWKKNRQSLDDGSASKTSKHGRFGRFGHCGCFVSPWYAYTPMRSCCLETVKVCVCVCVCVCKRKKERECTKCINYVHIQEVCERKCTNYVQTVSKKVYQFEKLRTKSQNWPPKSEFFKTDPQNLKTDPLNQTFSKPTPKISKPTP